jgi:hypothetical protein
MREGSTDLSLYPVVVALCAVGMLRGATAPSPELPLSLRDHPSSHRATQKFSEACELQIMRAIPKDSCALQDQDSPCCMKWRVPACRKVHSPTVGTQSHAGRSSRQLRYGRPRRSPAGTDRMTTCLVTVVAPAVSINSRQVCARRQTCGLRAGPYLIEVQRRL